MSDALIFAMVVAGFVFLVVMSLGVGLILFTPPLDPRRRRR
jgi:hypothetical protein